MGTLLPVMTEDTVHADDAVIISACDGMVIFFALLAAPSNGL